MLTLIKKYLFFTLINLKKKLKKLHCPPLGLNEMLKNIPFMMFYSSFALSCMLLISPESFNCVLTDLFSFFLPVLRFIKGTFPTNYIPTIEDTYRQVSIFETK